MNAQNLPGVSSYDTHAVHSELPLTDGRQVLGETRASVTEISHACGLGSSSYFGKVFREYMKCTPVEYRKRLEVV